jgi:hypothetical protein
VAAKGAIAADSYKMKLSGAEVYYYHVMEQLDQHPGEMACVGMGMGSGFDNTHNLHVMMYNKVTKDKRGWQVSTNDEHGQVVKRKVWQAIPPSAALKGATIIDSTWAMKKEK